MKQYASEEGVCQTTGQPVKETWPQRPAKDNAPAMREAVSQCLSLALCSRIMR